MSDFNPSQWIEYTPEKELYDIYVHTVKERFKAFGIRDEVDAIKDFSLPLHQFKPDQPIEQGLLDIIVTPESHERFTTDLEAYEYKHGLRSWREHEGSTVYLTDHGQFTDVPVLTETQGRIDPINRPRIAQVVSLMINTMELDIGSGPFGVTDMLSKISNVVQTVPRLEGFPSIELVKYREIVNEAGLNVLKKVIETKGASVSMSAIGRHNTVTKNGKMLHLHEPNKITIEALRGSKIKICGVYIDCQSFSPDGSINPADIRYSFLDPFHVTHPKNDTKKLMNFYIEATQKLYGEIYPSGIKIKSWKEQQKDRTVQRLVQAVIQDQSTETVY